MSSEEFWLGRGKREADQQGYAVSFFFRFSCTPKSDLCLSTSLNLGLIVFLVPKLLLIALIVWMFETTCANAWLLAINTGFPRFNVVETVLSISACVCVFGCVWVWCKLRLMESVKSNQATSHQQHPWQMFSASCLNAGTDLVNSLFALQHSTLDAFYLGE